MPRTGVIDFVEEKKLVEQIIMINWNPLACEPVKFKTYSAEPTTLIIVSIDTRVPQAVKSLKSRDICRSKKLPR
jgi:hypothetical protein